MKLPTIVFLVVLYKRTIKDAPSIQSLIRSRKETKIDCLFLLFDNSPEPITELEKEILIDIFPNFKYFNNGINNSLTIIYNKGISEIKNQDYQFLMVLDQDTSFGPELLFKLSKASGSNPEINLFLPYVKHNHLITSPGSRNGFKGKYWKELSTGKILANGIVAINSGMIIRMEYLNNSFPGYDEAFSFYGIDTHFMIEYQKRNKFLYILDYQILHELSTFEDEPVDVKLERFRNFFSSERSLTRGQTFYHFIGYFYLCYRSAYYAIKYWDFRFFWFNL